MNIQARLCQRLLSPSSHPNDRALFSAVCDFGNCKKRIQVLLDPPLDQSYIQSNPRSTRNSCYKSQEKKSRCRGSVSKVIIQQAPSFTPCINEVSRVIADIARQQGQRKPLVVLDHLQRQADRSMRLQQERESDKLKECSFQPKINQSSKSKATRFNKASLKKKQEDIQPHCTPLSLSRKNSFKNFMDRQDRAQKSRESRLRQSTSRKSLKQESSSSRAQKRDNKSHVQAKSHNISKSKNQSKSQIGKQSRRESKSKEKCSKDIAIGDYLSKNKYSDKAQSNRRLSYIFKRLDSDNDGLVSIAKMALHRYFSDKTACINNRDLHPVLPRAEVAKGVAELAGVHRERKQTAEVTLPERARPSFDEQFLSHQIQSPTITSLNAQILFCFTEKNQESIRKVLHILICVTRSFYRHYSFRLGTRLHSLRTSPRKFYKCLSTFSYSIRKFSQLFIRQLHLSLLKLPKLSTLPSIMYPFACSTRESYWQTLIPWRMSLSSRMLLVILRQTG